jgi:hypothetical protein
MPAAKRHQRTEMPDAASSAQQLFLQAQAAWTARPTPRFESFVLPCAATFLEPRCPSGGDVEFIVRLSDGRTYAQTVATGGAAPVTLMRGGYITGPAGAPLGFYRRFPEPDTPEAPPPPDLAADPLRTIATVTAIDVAYRITFAGNETTDGVDAAHLVLVPLRDPAAYPLRDLWIARDGYEIVRLTYALPYQHSVALVTYDFAPIGKPPLWTIARITASAGHETITEELREIAFPSDEPRSYFEPP